MIKSIKIENFQSHKDTVINFSPHVTCIIGLNNHGKSVILRALAKVIRDEPSGTDFIMDTPVREDECRVTLETSYGSVTRLVKRNSTASGNNMYKITKEGAVAEFSNFSKSGIPDEVLQVLGISNPIKFGDIELDLNFHHQLDTLFLMQGPGLPSLRGKVIGKVVNIDDLQRAIQIGAAEEKSLKKSIHSLEEDLEENRQQLAPFDHLDNVVNAVNYVDNLFGNYAVMKDTKQKLEEISNSVKSIVLAAKTQTEKINILNNFDDSLLPHALEIINKLNCLKLVLQLSRNIQLSQKVITSAVIEYDVNHLIFVTTKINLLRSFINLQNSLHEILRIVNTEMFVDVSDAEARLSHLKNIKTFHNNCVLYNSNLNTVRNALQACDKDLIVADTEFKDLKQELKVCPICMKPLI